MNAAQHPLYAVKSMLSDVVRDSDGARLAECLSGKYLPALGGQEHPADLLHHAVSLPLFDPALPKELTLLAATLCAQKAASLEDALRASSPLLDDETYVFNLLLFASYLPAEERLFTALKSLHQAGMHAGPLLGSGNRAGRQLRQTLTYQQADDSLEEYWLVLIEHSEERVGRLSTERKTDLLDAWKGLLWIPPSPAEREAGATLSVDRAIRGLLALHEAAGDSADGLPILRHAVRLLGEAYPRSPEFWSDHLSPRIEEWPELLREVVYEQWPLLAASTVEATPLMPADAVPIWEALTPEERARIEEIAAAGEPVPWNSFWQREMLFAAPKGGLAPQQWRVGLQRVRAAFESRFPALVGESHRPSLEEVAEADRAGSAASRQAGETKYGRRLAAFERVGKVLGEVDRLLEQNHPGRAQRYLNDLVRSQQDAETRPELVTKTLCNAAATALKHGHAAWAEELYRQAVDLGADNPVPQNGLAEVLKAQERLEEAEELYRQTAALFPNDVVARHGLANVLRLQKRFDEALELIPAPGTFATRHERFALHLRGMILLETGDASAAVEIFERAVESPIALRHKAPFRQALVTARLKLQHYEDALVELESFENPGPEVHTLHLHATAASGAEAEARKLKAELSADVLSFKRVVRDSIRLIERAWGLSNDSGLRQPSREEEDAVIEAEIEMLLAA